MRVDRDLLVGEILSLNLLWMEENTSVRLATQHKNGSQFCYLLAVSAIWRVPASFTSSASK